MRHIASARTTTRKALELTAVGLVILIATSIGTLVYQSTSSSAPSFAEVVSGNPEGMPREDIVSDDRRGAPSHRSDDHSDTIPVDNDVVTADDGVLPDGATVFDDEYPGIGNLDPDLLSALRGAALDAADDGITFYVTSGWRSPEYQNQLLREAVSEYGSQEEAARWVATAGTSAHVSGDAVDIGPLDAMAWLSEHGAAYGLCQIYGNEPWHFEFNPQAIDGRCPPIYADPTQDPRMQQ